MGSSAIAGNLEAGSPTVLTVLQSPTDDINERMLADEPLSAGS